MNNPPRLIVIGGCNGSGKSTFSNAITPPTLMPFDYDKVFLEIYNAQYDSELRERISHNQARNNLEHEIGTAISNLSDFSYETNFNSTPLYWPEIFKKAGYALELIYFCLNSVAEAKRRVQIRVENGGHFVPDFEIQSRFFLGYKHLNLYFSQFNRVHVIDSSRYGKAPVHLFSIENGSLVELNSFPGYLKELLPEIDKLINS